MLKRQSPSPYWVGELDSRIHSSRLFHTDDVCNVIYSFPVMKSVDASEKKPSTYFDSVEGRKESLTDLTMPFFWKGAIHT